MKNHGRTNHSAAQTCDRGRRYPHERRQHLHQYRQAGWLAGEGFHRLRTIQPSKHPSQTD